MYPFVNVTVTFKGKPLSKKYYNEHPKIHHLYPSQTIFMELYLPLLQKARETNTTHLLEITEKEIKINGLKMEIIYCTTCKKRIKRFAPAVYLLNSGDKKIWFCMKCAKKKRPPEMLSIT